MARFKEHYTLYSRKNSKGKNVWYYRTYDEYGRRTSGKSTGETSKTKARQYCEDLYKDGRLLQGKEITLNVYSENWWVWDKCKYIKGKLARSPKNKPSISRNYTDGCRHRLERHVLPYLGHIKLSTLSPKIIEKWMFELKDQGQAPKTINHTLSVLRIMITEACRLGIIHNNPFQSISPFANDPKIRGILSLKEARTLFNSDAMINSWKSEIYYSMNLLSAATAMRLGEIRGLLTEHFHDNYIHVCHSFGINGLGPTKTRNNRDIPLPATVSEVLKTVRSKSGYLFSYDNGMSPVNSTRATTALYVAMKTIGIDEQERRDRNITFHSWRHFFNTYLRGANITDAKIQAVTGHKSLTMTDAYTRFSLDNYSEVIKAQSELF